MKVEGINNVAGSYQGQGSSVSASAPVKVTESQAQSADVDIKPKTDGAEFSNNRGNGEKKVFREDGQASNEQLRQAVDKINKKALMGNGEAVFGIHDATNRVTIKIVDKKTKEVIKEFPPEKTLDMIAKVWEMAGIMVDEKR